MTYTILALLLVMAGIVVHELGHWATARTFGDRATLAFRWRPIPHPVCVAPVRRITALGGPVASFAFGICVLRVSAYLQWWPGPGVALDVLLFSVMSLLPFRRFDGHYIWHPHGS